MPASQKKKKSVECPNSPPYGCDADAIKIFVGNVPKSINEAQLLPLFEGIGPVVELVITRDKAKRSKGSAFVWYRHARHAEMAISSLNGIMLNDEQADQDGVQKGLEVRKAIIVPEITLPDYDRSIPQLMGSIPQLPPSGHDYATARVIPNSPRLCDSPAQLLLRSPVNPASLMEMTSGMSDRITTSVIITRDQISSVLNSLPMIKKITSTDLNISKLYESSPLDVWYSLAITGTNVQVLAAQTLFDSVLKTCSQNAFMNHICRDALPDSSMQQRGHPLMPEH